MELCSYRPKQFIFSQGDMSRSTYFIRRGIVRTFYVSPDGREFTVGLWSAGDMFGAPDVTQDTRSLSAVADTAVEVYALSEPDLALAVSRIPEFALGLVRALSFKVRWVTMLTKILSTQRADSRVCQMLLALSEIFGERHGEHVVLTRRFSHQELAMMVGCTRQWVTHTFRRLRHAGAIFNCADGRLVVVPARLYAAPPAEDLAELESLA